MKRSFLLAQSLSFLFLCVTALHLFLGSGELQALGSGVPRDVLKSFLSSPQALRDVAYALFALVLVHVAFGSVIFVAAHPLLRRIPESGSRLRVLWVVVLFAFALQSVLSICAVQYPYTFSGFLRGTWLANLEVIYSSFAIMGGLVLWGSVNFLGSRMVILLCSLAGGVFFWVAEPGGRLTSAEAAGSKRNVILIGIDALRPDHLGVKLPSGDLLTPNLDAFIAQSRNYTQAFTPVARTYTSWFTVLSGRYPVNSGVRFNLQPFDPAILKAADLQSVLGGQGYTRVYAMDERRFNNIDRRYGFDEVVGPQIGAADLVLGWMGDIPLVAVLSNNWVGRQLFPFVYSNRGVHRTYFPETFNQDLLGSVSRLSKGGEPLFLAMHLTLPHWPYLYREFKVLPGVEFDPRQPNYYFYLTMLREVDRQFSEIMAGLEGMGLLDDSLVILLSDHGESFMLEQDKLSAGVEGSEFPTDAHGHGTSVLSESQYHVVLAMRDYASREAGSSVDALVSLVDVAPTVVDWLGLEGDALLSAYDGVSLLSSALDPDRQIYLETEFSTDAMYQSQLNALRVIEEGAGYYRVSKDGLTVTSDEIGELIPLKQRAVIRRNWLLAHYPGVDSSMILVDRSSRRWYPTEAVKSNSREFVEMRGGLCSFFAKDDGFDSQGLCHAE